MTPAFDPTNDGYDIQIFHRLFQSKRCLAIVTAKPLPKLGTMKLYQNYGAIDCSVIARPIQLKLTENELKRLRNFHVVLFKDLVDTWKDFFVCDLEHTYMIAPMDGNAIWWDIVDEFQEMEPVREKSELERMNVDYRPEDWLHRVVCPWYRRHPSLSDERYVVTKILDNLRPNTKFPKNEYASYASYVEDKYQARVMQPKQFLLLVKGVTQKLNRLHPGQGENGKKIASAPRTVILIPELCHNFKFPGDLWLKMTMLPTVLHRVQYLLLAEELRIEINQYVGLDIENYEPRPVMEKMICRPQYYNFEYHIKQTNFSSIITKQGKDESLLRKVPSLLRDQQKLLDICVPSLEKRLRIDILNITESPRGIEQHELLAAITSHSAHDVFDMERLEVLGDAFLKFSVSLYLIHAHPSWHEGFLTYVKCQLVSNRNLCCNAIHKNLPGMIKANIFKPRDDWIPPMVRVDESLAVSYQCS